MIRVSTCLWDCRSCAKHGNSAWLFVASMTWTYAGDVNSALGENWKEHSSSTISSKASYNGEGNVETRNLYKACWQ